MWPRSLVGSLVGNRVRGMIDGSLTSIHECAFGTSRPVKSGQDDQQFSRIVVLALLADSQLCMQNCERRKLKTRAGMLES